MNGQRMSKTFKRLGETAQRTGYRFEKYFARLLGSQPIRGSGSQWTAKLDIRDGAVLWSLKHTDADSFRLSNDLMQEAVRAIYAPGGTGGDLIPGIALSINGEIYTVLRGDDFLRLMTSEAPVYIPQTKGDAKRSRARVPNLFKDLPAEE